MCLEAPGSLAGASHHNEARRNRSSGENSFKSFQCNYHCQKAKEIVFFSFFAMVIYYAVAMCKNRVEKYSTCVISRVSYE